MDLLGSLFYFDLGSEFLKKIRGLKKSTPELPRTELRYQGQAYPLKSTQAKLTLIKNIEEDSQSPAKEKITPWESDEGIRRLERSKHKKAFFHLANHYQMQSNKIYCGVASMVMLMNALRLKKIQKYAVSCDQSSIPPEQRIHIPEGFNPFFERYTQENFWEKSTHSKKALLGFPDPKTKGQKFGFTLNQMKEVLNTYDFHTEVWAVDDFNRKIAKERLKSSLCTTDSFVVCNFLRETLGQKYKGHISPIAAYDEVSDSVLLLDVNPNMNSWLWINFETLVESMKTFDEDSRRGFLIVSEKNGQAKL